MPNLYGLDFDFGGMGTGANSYHLSGFPTKGGRENLGLWNPLAGFGMSMPSKRPNNPGAWYNPNAPVNWLSTMSDALYKATLGQSPPAMASALGATRATGAPWSYPESNIMAVYDKRGQFDKAMHAYASYLAQRRYGTVPATLMGVGKEGLDVFTGQASTDDLAANLLGVLLGRQAPQ